MVESGEVRVTIERTGGVAGIPLRRSISTNSLSPGQQQTLKTLLENADFFDLVSYIKPGSPDRFVFTITVETPTQTHTVKVNEPDISDSLHGLIEWIMKAAR
jgi:hypothetical protein